MKKIFNRYLWVVLALSAVLLAGQNAWALGLGAIRVESQYDKNFVAVVPVLVGDSDKKITALAGSVADYGLLQVPRPSFVDSLSFFVGDNPDKKGGKAVTITSTKPITAASFNLVVRVTSGTDSVLENYFIAMDFKKSLSLELPKPALVEAPAPIVPLETAKTEAPPPVEKKVEKAEVKKAEPSVPINPTPLSAVEKRPAPEEPKPNPVEPKSKAAETDQPSAFVKVSPDRDKNKVVIRHGDTLFSIARTLRPEGTKVTNGRLFRATVAIYLENKEKFVNGNINSFYVGTVLYYDKVNEIAAALSEAEVRRIISSGHQSAEGEKGTQVVLPLERPVPDSKITDFLEKWRKHWAENSPELADDYADQFRAQTGAAKSAWIEFKREMVETNSNVVVSLDGLRIARAGSLIGAHFVQNFRADQYVSAGRKKLLLKPFPSGLKIVGEVFVPIQAADHRKIWVLQVSEQQTIEAAKLELSRQAGNRAYEAGFLAGPPPYKIIVGRFPGTDSAEAWKKMIGAGGQGVKVLKLPFSLKLGSFDKRTPAAELMDKLEKKGYSSYTLEKMSGERTEYGVYLGAFQKKAEAENAAKISAKEGFSPVVVTP